MPIYEYQCDKCENIDEYILSIDEESRSILLCSKCGSTTSKVISKTNFKLEGTGWSKDSYQKRNSIVDNPLK